MAEQRTLDAERARAIAEEDAYPHPGDNPHASVHTRNTDRSLAFRTGWAAALAYVAKADAARRAPPALDAEGLPELPEPIDELFQLDGFNTIGLQAVYTAEQVRQAMRDAVAADRRAHGKRLISINEDVGFQAALVDLMCAAKNGLNVTAQSERVQALTDVIDAALARQSAPEGAPVGMEAVYQYRNRTVGGEWIECRSNTEAMLEDGPAAGIYEFRTLYDPTSAHAQPEAQAFELLRQLLASSSGKQVLWKLSDGIGTDTNEGHAWLAAKALVEAQAASAQPADQNKMENNDD